MPGMYAMISLPLLKRTLATFRSAELGFLGVTALTSKHTPRFCGQPPRATFFFLAFCTTRGLRISWLTVGILTSLQPVFPPAIHTQTPSPDRRPATRC